MLLRIRNGFKVFPDVIGRETMQFVEIKNHHGILLIVCEPNASKKFHRSFLALKQKKLRHED
jgi:hypothetical protein